MNPRRRLGVGAVSALLTILLLVAGFAVSTGMLSALHVSQAEVMKKAVNVGEAVAERLQAYVYEDVRTNRTLLTIRNAGSTGSEVEYIMAVGYEGEVLAEARLGETLRLGTQQSLTIPLSDLLGAGFDNYTEVRSQMATLYLKTVKGGVFGSGYMAPPSVMTAAYATSTTTVETTETSTSQLGIETGRTDIFTYTQTVIIDNPQHWPVEAYVGISLNVPRPIGIPIHITMDGFPEWGGSPAKLPRIVTCWMGRYQLDFTGSRLYGEWSSWSGWPIVKYSRLGPTYIRLQTTSDRVPYTSFDLCGPEPFEQFIPYGLIPRIGPTSFLSTSTSIITYETRGTTTYTTTYTVPFRTVTGTITTRITYTTTSHRFTTTGYFPTTTDFMDEQVVTFPDGISYVTYDCRGWCFTPNVEYWATKIYMRFRLHYIIAVNLWNTTEVLAYAQGNSTNTIHIKADRPIGLAAVYVYERTDVVSPPPWNEWGGSGQCYERETVAVCPACGYGEAVTVNIHSEVVPCGQGDGMVTVTVNCNNPNDRSCGIWIPPQGKTTFSASEAQRCVGTCQVPSGSTIVAGVAQSGECPYT